MDLFGVTAFIFKLLEETFIVNFLSLLPIQNISKHIEKPTLEILSNQILDGRAIFSLQNQKAKSKKEKNTQ